MMMENGWLIDKEVLIVNLGKELANIFKSIGKSLNISPPYKEKYKYKPKSDNESLKEDWDTIGNTLNEIMGNDKK